MTLFGQFLQRISTSYSNNDGTVSYSLISFYTFAVTWLSWRLWAFTIKPAFEPKEPREMPYWIPLIGHAVSFFRDTEGTFTKAREYFGDSREPFGLTIAGQRLYIVTSPQHVTEVYKNTKTLTFLEYVQDVMKSIGVSEDGIAKLWKCPKDTNSSTQLHKPLAHAGEDFYRDQLLPGDHLDVLWKRVFQYIDSSMQWDTLPQSAIIDRTYESYTLSLLEWTRDVLLKAVTTAFFGDRLLELEPQLLKYFVAFDDESWKLTYKYPRSMSKKMYTAKDKMLAGIEAWLRLPKNKRPEGAWLIQKLEAETNEAGITVHDLAAMVTSLVWVILSNAYKLCFWIMAYLVSDLELYAAIKLEIRMAVCDGSPGLETRLEECPQLVALYNEVLRLTTASASIRTVESATPLGNVTLRAGGKVLLPFRQLHFNTEVFGANVHNFDPERFLRDKNLSKSPSFRPFGGGSTYCPGRYVARREVLAFIALAMYRFDIKLAGMEGLAFPKLDTKKPSLGIMMPRAGEDVQVIIERAGARKHTQESKG